MKYKYTKIIVSLALLVVMTDAAMISIKVHGFYTHFIKLEQTNTSLTLRLDTRATQSEVKATTHKQI